MLREMGFKKLNKVLVFVLVTVLFVTSSFIAQNDVNKVEASINVASKVSNPRLSASGTTWDCVYFGSYYQSDDGNGGYKKEPIKWRVLEKKDGELFLLADQSLESIQYNQVYNKINPETGERDLSWANSDLREWLNDDFYNEAFTSDEKAYINRTTVTADASPQKTIEELSQGPDTEDYVYILSAKEALSTKYGFEYNYIPKGQQGEGSAKSTLTRCSVNTDYTHRYHRNQSDTLGFNDPNQPNVVVDQQPTISTNILSKTYGPYKDTGIWWLRTIKSNGTSPYYMYRVDYDGVIKEKPASENNACVRPVIKVDQDSPYLTYVGTTDSNGHNTGVCGDDVSYEINGNTLRIFGSGPMYDFDETDAPWHDHHEEILSVTVDDTVSYISENAFKDCANIAYIYLNDNVTSISEDAFGNTEMHDDLFISVAENSAAQSICADYNWNYTTIRSIKPLCREIREIKDTVQTADTLAFKFDNPCIGQSYEIYMDDVLVQTKTDLTDIVECCITGITPGKHTVKVNAMVEGSEGFVRRDGGKVIRINDQSFDDPEWIDRSIEKVRWDTLYFGRYPQSEDPEGDYTCTDYAGNTRTFKTEPIKWRVLSHEGHELLLLADESIENRQFNTTNSSVWRTSTLRAWLNNDDANAADPGFIARAFNEKEKAALIETDTPTNTDTVGKETKDKVWLMSLDEAKKDEYGFISSVGYARCRRANGTDYAIRNSGKYPSKDFQYPWFADCQTYVKEYKGTKSIIDPDDSYHKRATIWWFRDKSQTTCARSDYPGNIDEAKNPTGENAMVRPMIKIDDRSTAISDAGTISSYGETTGPIKYCNVYIDGDLVDRVKEGATYELPEELSNTKKRSATPDANIGYIDDENKGSVYHSGQVFSITRDRSFSTLKVKVDPAGTAIRMVKGESHGLAFQCQATVTAESNPENNPIHTKAFEYGTLVTTYDDYADTYDYEVGVDTQQVEGHPIYNIRFREQDFTKKPQLYIVGITNLRKQNYAREYVAKPYVIIHYEGTSESVVVYPDDTPLFVKSAKQVAENLMKSDKWKTGGYNAWQKEWITSYTILD